MAKADIAHTVIGQAGKTAVHQVKERIGGERLADVRRHDGHGKPRYETSKIVPVRGDFRIDVYERPVQRTRCSLSLEVQRELLEDQHDIGPLMANDKSLAMIERLGVFWMQTGAMLECTIHDNRNIPGQLFQLLPGFGNLLRLFLGEALQRIDCDIAVGFQHLRKLRFVQSGKPGSFLERMFRSHDHQKQEITRADVLKTETDQDLTGDPSLHSLRSHVASLVSRWR